MKFDAGAPEDSKRLGQPSKSILGSSPLVAFVPIRDPERAKAFYTGTLGLQFISQDQFAVVFDVRGTMLRAAVVHEMNPAKYTVLGWEVPDIIATANELVKAGVKLERFQGLNDKDELAIWVSPSGAKVAWFKDPDGNLLSITQF